MSDIMGEGHHIAPNGLKSNEIVVFSYDGNIVCIARTDNIMVDPSKKGGRHNSKGGNNPSNLADILINTKKGVKMKNDFKNMAWYCTYSYEGCV